MSLLQRYRGQVDPLRSERAAELAVLVLLGLLVLQLLWGAYRGIFPDIPEPVSPTAEALEVQPLNATVDVSPELRNEIRQRPLFWATRRPVDPVAPLATATAEAKAEQKQAAKIAGLELAGVFGAGESAGIIVLAKEKNKKHRVMVNEEIRGWTLESVSSTEAVLSSNGRQATLALQRGDIWVPSQDAASSSPAAPESVEPPVEATKPVKKKNTAGKAKAPKNNKAKNDVNEDSLTLGRGSR